MRKNIIGIVIATLALAITVIAFAAKPKVAPLAPVTVTVAVDGLHCQACVDELQTDLGKVPGVSEVKVTLKPAQVTAKLDESKTAASQLVNVIAAHPQTMDKAKNYGAKLVAYIDTAMCATQKTMCDACFTEIPKVLKAVKGVNDVTLDESGKVASIGFAKDAVVTTSTLAKALSQSDFKFTVAFSSVASTTTKAAADNAGGSCERMGAGEGCERMDAGTGCDMGAGGQGCGM